MFGGGALSQPPLRLPAPAEDTSLSRSLWSPAGSCHLRAVLTPRSTLQLSAALPALRLTWPALPGTDEAAPVRSLQLAEP